MAITKPSPLNLTQHAINVGDTAEFVSKFNNQQAKIHTFAAQLNAMCNSIESHIASALQDYPGIYLGTFSGPPTAGIAGEPLQHGMIYHHNLGGGQLEIRVYGSAGWQSIQMSAAAILAALKTVDGSGSGLDADLWNGMSVEDVFGSTSRVRISLEGGNHGLSCNDGSGNFNVKVGTSLDGLLTCTENGYGSHWDFNQGTGVWRFKVSSSGVKGEPYDEWFPLLHLAEPLFNVTTDKFQHHGRDLLTEGSARKLLDKGAVGATAGNGDVWCNLSEASVFMATLASANATGTLTFNFTNLPDTAEGVFSFDLILIRGGRKALAFNCSGKTLKWAANTAPVLSDSATDMDIISFHISKNGALRAAHTWSGPL